VFDDARWIAQLAHWSADLPKPRAILIVSAHWESAPMMLSRPDRRRRSSTTSAGSPRATSA
jgi:4,5-DOPA dioxygenase extradiol